jgi:hypothetical protein
MRRSRGPFAADLDALAQLTVSRARASLDGLFNERALILGILRKIGRAIYITGMTMLALTGAFIVLAVVLYDRPEGEGAGITTAPAADPVRAEEEASAPFRYACREFTKAQLLDPASAEFTASLNWGRARVSEDRWRIVSEVTATNAFGGRVASRFLCDVEAVGENIRLVSISEIGR